MKKTKCSDDFRKNLSGTVLDLLELHISTMKKQMRIKLHQSLLNKKLATRDIFHFVKGQASLRQFDKTPD